MTFTATGSLISATASTFTLTPANVGDLICLEVIQAFDVPTKYASALSSSNVTWTTVGHYEGSTFEGSAALFIGTVTSTSGATVTVTWTGGTPGDAIVVAGHEYSSSAGSWTVDTSGHIDSAGTNTWASLTPAGAGELYFGYAYSGSASAGSTSGYTYAIDSDSNCCAWNASCTSSAQAPQTGDSAEALGMMMLVKETVLAVTTTSLPAAATGIAYSQALAATAGTSPYTWSISSGALPSWANLNTSTGAITGTPSDVQGGSSFTAEVTDSASNTATQALTIGVNSPVTLVGSVGSTSGTSSPLTAVFGQAPTANNLLLALVSAGSTTAETPAISTAAAGWSRLGSGTTGNSGSAHVSVDAWVKTATGGDAAPTFTQTLSGSPELACYMLELNGANLGTPLDVSGVFQSGSSTGTVTFTLAATPGNYGEFAADIMAMERATGTFAWTETGSGWTSAGKLPSGGAVISTQANYRAAPTPLSSLTDAGHFGTDSTAYGAGLIVVIAGQPVIAVPSTPPPQPIPPGFTSPMAFASLPVLPGNPPAAGGPAPVPDTDAGSGAESSTITASLSDTETGGAADTASVLASLSGTDTGSGAEAAAIAVPDTDAGTGADAGSISAALTGTDTGSGADSATVSVSDTDAGTGADSGSAAAALAGTDTGSGADAATVSVPDTDSGSGADAGSVSAGDTDSGSGADAGSLTASASDTDAGSAADAGSVSAALSDTDTGTGADSATALAAINPAPFASTSGQQTSGSASITVTLPSYTTGDAILLIVNSNQSQSSMTFSAAISSATQLPSGGAGGYLWAFLLTPNGTGQTTFTVTGSTSGVWSWWCANYRGASVTLPVATDADATGNSTSATIAMPEAGLGYIATGAELMISAGGVNSTATWTTDANTQFHTTANSAALMVDAVNLTAGQLTGVPAAMNRGLSGTNRNQNSLALVLQVAPGGIINLLSNPSFESGSTIATGWTDEHTTATEATYSIVSSGVTDGTTAQQFAYSGVSADGGTAKTELYQAPISATPGQYLTFSVWLSGSFTNAYGFIGIEGFTSGSVYISEADTNVLTLTSTPVLYSVSYLCPPGTDHVAVYIQCPEIGGTSVLSVTMDQAELTAAAVTVPPSPPPPQLTPPGFSSPMSFAALPQAVPSGMAAPQPVSGTDTGSGADSGSVAATLSDTDSGSGADAASVAVLAADTGTGADTGQVSAALSDTDAGSGADSGAVTVLGSDTGTGADSGAVSAALSDTDAGTGADAGALDVAGTDTGAGADAGQVAVSLSDTDAGSGADAGTLTATLSDTDSGSGADAGTVQLPSAPPPLLIPPGPFSPMAFSALPVIPPSVAPVQIAGTDTGSGADSATVSVTDTEAGTGADTALISVTGTDTGSGADVAAAPVVAGAETGTAADAGTVSVSSADAGTGADSSTLAAALASPDTGSGADAGTAGLPSADTGTGADSGTLEVTGSDTGAGAEGASAPAALGSTDTGTAAEGGTASLPGAEGRLRASLLGGSAVPAAQYAGTAVLAENYAGTATDASSYAGSAT